MTYEKFLAAFKATWEAPGRAPNVISVGTDKAAQNVRRCLDDLGLDAHIIVDPEASPNRLLMTHSDDMALMPGDAVHKEHGYLLGGGKN